jgi:hypothetical protein
MTYTDLISMDKYKKVCLREETMLNTMLNNKVILFWCILTLIVCSITITLLSHNTLADSVSISFTVFAGFALFFTAAMWLEDTIREICNP